MPDMTSDDAADDVCQGAGQEGDRQGHVLDKGQPEVQQYRNAVPIENALASC